MAREQIQTFELATLSKASQPLASFYEKRRHFRKEVKEERLFALSLTGHGFELKLLERASNRKEVGASETATWRYPAVVVA